MAGNVCDICCKDDLPTFVRSSVLGAISFAYCEVCYSMEAEPKNLALSFIEQMGGIEALHRNFSFTYYEQLTDSYMDIRDGVQNIVLEDGREFKTREAYLKSRQKDI